MGGSEKDWKNFVCGGGKKIALQNKAQALSFWFTPFSVMLKNTSRDHMGYGVQCLSTVLFAHNDICQFTIQGGHE